MSRSLRVKCCLTPSQGYSASDGVRQHFTLKEREIIESRFNVPFFEGEVLSHSITRAVTLCGCPSARAGEEFLTERQVVMPTDNAGAGVRNHPRGAQMIRGRVLRPIRVHDRRFNRDQ